MDFQIFWRQSLSKVKGWVKFLFHAYGAEQFSVEHARSNFLEIIKLREGGWLDATQQGRLRRLTTPFQKALFFLKNGLLLGDFQHRVEQSVYFTFVSLCIEIYNPFDEEILNGFIERKVTLLTRILETRVKKINGQKWAFMAAKLNIAIFERSSLLQKSIIKKMRCALKKQKVPEVVYDAALALKKGLHPILVVQGLSGTYWMRSQNQEIAGLFKPFDEEAFAPNNPCGIDLQGALGKRRMRLGIRVGESIHREVAAYVVDQFFGFGIVPRTYYATFAHPVFYHALTQWKTEGFGLRRSVKTKMGSFQEYIEGFKNLDKISKEEWDKIPEIEYQLLVVLDVILGNLDRNLGNILIGDEKIAAIDHGLTFPDINGGFSFWYWGKFEQGQKPLAPALVELLRDFPFDALKIELKKKCFIDDAACQRMKERVMLFREGVLRGMAPKELSKLFTDENLAKLRDYDETLSEKANLLINELQESQ